MAGEPPASSRKMVTARAGWMAVGQDEESRAYLQTRLVLLSKLMFWSFIVLLGSMVGLYWRYPRAAPIDNNDIYVIATVGVLTLAVIWRGFLVRKQLPLKVLYGIDYFYAAGTGSIFAAAAYIAWDRHLSAMVNLIWAILVTFLRTIVIPSTGTRSAVAGTLTFIPLMLAALGLALTTTQDLPPDAYFMSALIISVTVVVLATIGSRVIYGLRRQAQTAMRLGQYTLDSKIGEGGNGSVYRAHHALLRRETAIKLMLPDRIGADTVDRFEREVQHMSQLTHWNTVAVYDYGRNPDGLFYYAMEYLDGINLENLVIDYGRQPQDRVVAILRQVCGALKEAHRRGIIHRDIKPDNVLFQEGQALLTDFGIALPRGDEEARDRLTGSGMTLGTPRYMSPEQVAGQSLDARSDIHALGVLAYEMLAGQPPFTGPTATAILGKVMTESPRPIVEHRRSVPPHVSHAISKALEKLPADRWQTPSEFVEALNDERTPGAHTGSARGSVLVPWLVAGALALALGWTSWRASITSPPSQGPVRFGVEFEPGVVPSFTPIVRLSADGRQLFVSAMVDRREEVVRRTLDRMGMEVIKGAGQGEQGTGNSRPFVSPDGRWVAYARQKKLWKVPVEGGTAIELATADWAGGSWGLDGRIVYTQAYNTGLWMVSEGGGDARMLTTPDATKGELGHWWPQILPDGDHVLFTAYRTPLDTATIEVLTISSGERRVLLTGGVYGLFVPTGHLLFAVGESIRAVPFDLDTLAVMGSPRAVVEDVAMNLTDGAAAFDVSETGTLAYLPVDSYVSETNVVFVDRSGKETPALPGRDRYTNPRLSPDGTRLSVDIRSANSQGDVWVFDVGRSGGTRITSEDGRDFGAEWSPDGRELVYSSERPFFDLYRRASDATRPAEPLLTGKYDHYTGSVSPDGKTFVFVMAVPGGELWTVNLQGPPMAARYFGNGFNLGHPTLSPDGRWMAYDSDESGQGVDVFIQSYPDPKQKRLKISPAHGSEPRWTRGGRELVYREDDKVMAVDIDPATGASGPPRQLFSGPYPSNQGWTRPRSFDVTPDGERFLLTKLPGEQPRPRIVVVLNWFDELIAKVPR